MWFLPLTTAAAATWTVGPGGGHATVTSAVLAAANGDVIEVRAGTYVESVDTRGKDLVIRGVEPGVVMTPPGSGSAFSVLLGEEVEIEALTIRPGVGRALDAALGVVRVRDVQVEGGGEVGSVDGGAFRARDATLRLEGVLVTGSSGRRGGAVYGFQGASVELVRSSFVDCVGSYGAGVMVYDADLFVDDVTITGARAGLAGGAVNVSGGSLTGSDLRVIDAIGERTPGVGVLLTRGSLADLAGGAFTGGRLAEGFPASTGGAFHLEGASYLRLQDVDITGNSAGKGAGVALFDTSRADLVDVRFSGDVAGQSGGSLYLEGASQVSCDACAFSDERAGTGGAVFVTGTARFEDRGSTFSGCRSSNHGGAVAVSQAATLAFHGSTFLGNVANGAGGAVRATNVSSEILFDSALFDGNDASTSFGGAVDLGTAASARFVDVTFRRNRSIAGGGGGLSWQPTSGTLTLIRTTFDENEAGTDGGGLLVRRGALSLADVRFDGNRAGADGGGARVDEATSVDVVRTVFFANDAGEDGGGWAESSTAGVSLLRNTVFQENLGRRGGGVATWSPRNVELRNNTFVGNGADDEGGHVWTTGGPVRLVNDVFAWASDGGGVWGDASSIAATDRYFNAVFENAGLDWVGAFDDPTGASGNLDVDPQFRRLGFDGDPDNDDLHPAIGSPLVDAGSPSILDRDGSVSDVGAFGGPEAAVQDVDLDGFFDHVDCDDLDADVHPGAPEVRYDGVDQDCDGSDVEDADLDGWTAHEVGGYDCDDADPFVSPDADDLPYDGVDQDCDGWDDFDADRDGFAASAWGGLDCDDQDPEVRPGAVDVPYDDLDTDCDGRSDHDADLDGYDDLEHGGVDCDDTDPFTHPFAPETPYDAVDQDCDGSDTVDVDGDGYFGLPVGGTDCDDQNAAAWPGAPDAVYDGVDTDCDGWSDFDADRDGHDDRGHGGLDCDDLDALVHPGAEDVPYDGFDADCDARSDYDADHDGYDAVAYGGDDCDDSRARVHPGAHERGNGLDDDCDGFPEDVDRDADGLTDFEEWALGTDPLDPDTDGDSRDDGKEASTWPVVHDTDGDGVLDPRDPDDDGDGIPSLNEWTVDVDHDGYFDTDVDGDFTPNALDVDSDGDGLPDATEGEVDRDGNDVPDYAWYDGDYGGGGCSGGNASFLFPVVGLLGWFGRGRRKMVIALCSASAAHAGGLDAHGLDVLRTDGDGIRVEPGTPPEGGTWAVALTTDVAADPLVERRPDGAVPVVDTLVTSTLSMSLSPRDNLRVDLHAPFHPLVVDRRGATIAAGDLRLSARLGLDRGDGIRPNLALVPSLWVPTGTAKRWTGSPTAAGGAVLVIGWGQGPAEISFNLGARVAPAKAERNLRVGSGPSLGVAGRLDFSPRVAVLAELVSQGSAGLRELPLEATGGVRFRFKNGAFLAFTAGTGLTDAAGTTRWRGLVTFGVVKSRPVAVLPPPPPEPEPLVCEDTCAEPPPPPPPPAPAVLEDNKIVLYENLFFVENSAQIRLPDSAPVLGAVRDILVGHPEIDHLLVEGHTNHHGSASYNYDLSDRRARAVVDWLIGEGIDRNRLIYKGYGFDRPLLPADDPLGATVNRRVEFTVLRSDEVPGDARVPEAETEVEVE